MNRAGRPLRFFGLVLVCWTGARVAMLWPRTPALAGAATAVPTVARAEQLQAPAALALPEAASLPEPASRHRAQFRYRAPLGDDDPRVQLALLGLVQYGEPEYTPRPDPPRPALSPRVALMPERLDPLPDRWALSTWLVARGNGGTAAAPGGQIGGGQAGARLAFLLAPRQRLAAYARAATPLRGPGREAALGLEWQPGRAPVRLVAERRFGLDGQGGGTGLGAIAGIDKAWRGIRLEAYGQAGVVLRRRTDPYADGAARGLREVQSGPVRVALGGGAWGAAQRDAQRLDIGPSAALQVRNLRFALDWRQRVAGEARPGSGLALTLGADF